MAEAEVRLKFHGPAVPAKPKKMRTQENAEIGAPGQISISVRRRRSESE